MKINPYQAPEREPEPPRLARVGPVVWRRVLRGTSLFVQGFSTLILLVVCALLGLSVVALSGWELLRVVLR